MASITRRIPLDYVMLLAFSLTFALRMSVHDRMHKQDCQTLSLRGRSKSRFLSSFIPSSRHGNPVSLNMYSNANGCVIMLMRIQLSIRHQFWHDHDHYTHPFHIFVVYCIRLKVNTSRTYLLNCYLIHVINNVNVCYACLIA